MPQTLHIFKKDIRYLRADIAVILALMALFAYTDSHWSPVDDPPHFVFNQTTELLRLLLPISWLYLIARLVHAEPLVGDRQFWLTRPYQWTSLLSAKALFIITIISVPKAITDAIIVTVQDLPLSQYLPGFLCRELLIAVVMLLPLAALASVTGGITQVAITVFVFVGGSIGISEALMNNSSHMNLDWGDLEWIRSMIGGFCMSGAALIVVLLQYRYRRATVSRATGIAALLLGMVSIPWMLAFAIQSRLSNVSIGDDVRITLDSTRQPRGGRTRSGGGGFLIPVAIAGIPDGAEIRDDRIDLAASGIINRLQGDASVIHDPDGYWIEIPVEGPVDHPAGGPVSVRASLFLTMFGDAHTTTIPVGGSDSAVPEVGNCFMQSPRLGVTPRFYTTFCASAFRWPRRLISVHVDGATSDFRDRPYSPLPADVGISPVTSWATQVVVWGARPQSAPVTPPARTATITVEEPLAHFHRNFAASIPGWSR